MNTFLLPSEGLMTQMETFAIAARLHVVMRRAMGRVTDVEWMTRSRDYASEVIRLARLHTDPELLELADKFEASLAELRRAVPAASKSSPAAPLVAPVTAPMPVELPDVPRYVGRLR